jgi:hypothetical protein
MKKTWMIILGFLCLMTAPIHASGLNYTEISNAITSLSGVQIQSISANLNNDAGTESIQNIQVIGGSDEVLMTTWSYFDGAGNLVNKDVLNLARDFNLKNPNYEVIAGVNGDYFTTGSTINASMIFGSKLIKSNNHDKYFAIELDSKGSYKSTIKTMGLSDSYKLYIYNHENDALMAVVKLENINDSTIEVGQTGIFYNYDALSKASGKHYSYDLIMKTNTNNQFYLFGKNPIEKQGVIETTNTRVSVLSRDEHIQSLLSVGYVKIQKEVKGVNEGSTLLGVDSQIIQNNTIKAFSEIGGQSASNNESRHPRTGIGFDEQNRPILITVDGRQTGFSQGVNLREFAKIMQVHGIVNGFNLDGGGSTQAIIKDGNDFKVLNRPSEGGPTTYRSVSNAVFFIKPKTMADIITDINQNELTLTLPSMNYEVFIQGVKQSLNSSTLVVQIDPNVDQAISVVDLTNHMAVFNQVIFVTYIKPIIQPVFTEITHEIIANGVSILIHFDDPDRLIDRMYVIHQESEVQKVALVQYAGLRKAVFDHFIEGENHYTIHFELKNGTKDTIEYHFVYNIEIPIEEPNTTAFPWAFSISIAIPSLLLMTGAVWLLATKRKSL